MTTEATEQTDADTPAGQPQPTAPTDGDAPEPDTFPREYVEKLRAETAKYRTRAQHADALAERLLQATIREAAGSILADPTDLPLDGDLVDDDGLPDTEKITEAAKALAARKPHLALRRPTGNVGQGARPEPTTTSLVDLLRGTAS